MYKAVAAVVGSLVLGSAANAATIDVDNLLEPPLPYFNGGGMGASAHASAEGRPWMNAYQTWTVGQSGRLDRVDIFGNAIRTMSFDNVVFALDTHFLVTLTILGGATEGFPGGVELGSVTRSASELGGGAHQTSSFDLSGLGISAAQGDLLTFRMSVEACPQVAKCSAGWSSWNTIEGVGTTNGYAGGRAFLSTPAGLYWSDNDLNFRTWMSAVPEPSTWAMMIVGFGAVGAMVRTSRRRSGLGVA